MHDFMLHVGAFLHAYYGFIIVAVIAAALVTEWNYNVFPGRVFR